MITFGYNNKFSTALRALAAIGIGLVMVFSTEATVNVVKIIAAFLFAAGMVSLGYGFAHRKSGAMALMSVNAVVDIVIGLLLFCFPNVVAGAIVTIIGVVILLFGVLQLIVLGGTMSLVGMGGFSLILSILAVIGGITLLFNPFSERIMSVLAGIFLIFYGISELISMRRVSKAKVEYEIRFNRDNVDDDDSVPQGLGDVKDVDYHKVDDR